MKPDNLKLVTNLCKKLEQLKHHRIAFNAIMTEDLTQGQFELQAKYDSDLQKEIRKTEKDISEL